MLCFLMILSAATHTSFSITHAEARLGMFPVVAAVFTLKLQTSDGEGGTKAAA